MKLFRVGLVLVPLFAACASPTTSYDEGVLFGDDTTSFDLREARQFTVPGTNTRIAVWDRSKTDVYSAFSRGGKFTTPKKVDQGIKAVNAIRPGQKADGDTYVVRFHTYPIAEYRTHMATLGVESFHYFPHNALIVRMSKEAKAQLEQQQYVAEIAAFNSEQKTSRDWLVPDPKRPRPTEDAEFLVQPLVDSNEARQALAAQIDALGGQVDGSTVTQFALRVFLTPDMVGRVAKLDDVLFVEKYSAPEADMDKVRDISGANYLQREGGFEGTGVRGEVMDGGVHATHVDFASRLVKHGTASDDWHGTCTTGIVFGDGTGNAAAKGLLPKGTPIFADYDAIMSGGDRYAHTKELLAPPYEAVFQSNSWGSSLTTQYTSTSAAMDKIIFELDFLILNSQSNTGNQNSRPEAWAKNVLAIGGVKHFDTLTTDDDKWSRGGSIGPASDGRLSVKLAHFWDETLTTSNTSDTGYERAFGGTSGATPITAGHAGLFFEMWAAGVFGNATTGATVFARRPHFTTAQAVLMNTATQWAFQGKDHDLARSHQGYGRADVKRMWDLRQKIDIINETDVLLPQQTTTYKYNVAAGEAEFRATMVFADPPAVPGAAKHRVNDLTMKVTAPNGKIYWGNFGLDANMYSQEGGTPNNTDTYEMVMVKDPAAGEWTVEVRADEVVQDGHVETPELDVDYALVVSGITKGGNPPVNSVPSVGFNAPLENEEVQGKVLVSAFAQDTDGAITKVVFNLNGTMVEDTEAPFEVEWDTTGLAAGAYAFSVVAFDDKGATSAPANRSVTLKVGPSACTEGAFAAAGLPLAIEDFTSVTSSITLQGPGKVDTLAVSYDIEHTYRGDLDVTLTSPSGKSFVLFNTNGPGLNLQVSNRDLAQFANETLAGRWTLTVEDKAAIDTGSLLSWSLKVKGSCQ